MLGAVGHGAIFRSGNPVHLISSIFSDIAKCVPFTVSAYSVKFALIVFLYVLNAGAY